MQLLLKNVDTGSITMEYNINSSNSVLTDSSGVTYALAPQTILALEIAQHEDNTNGVQVLNFYGIVKDVDSRIWLLSVYAMAQNNASPNNDLILTLLVSNTSVSI